MAQVSKKTAAYVQRSTTPGQYCKGCASRKKPVACSAVFGCIRRLAWCNIWSAAPTP